MMFILLVGLYSEYNSSCNISPTLTLNQNYTWGHNTLHNWNVTTPSIGTFASSDDFLNNVFSNEYYKSSTNYVDPGAQCTSNCSGEILNVTVAGYVNISQNGSYVIQYDCQDEFGNTQTSNRSVTVVQNNYMSENWNLCRPSDTGYIDFDNNIGSNITDQSYRQDFAINFCILWIIPNPNHIQMCAYLPI